MSQWHKPAAYTNSHWYRNWERRSLHIDPQNPLSWMASLMERALKSDCYWLQQALGQTCSLQRELLCPTHLKARSGVTGISVIKKHISYLSVRLSGILIINILIVSVLKHGTENLSIYRVPDQEMKASAPIYMKSFLYLLCHRLR